MKTKEYKLKFKQTNEETNRKVTVEVILSNLKEARKQGVQKLRQGDFVSLSNGKGTLLPLM